MENFAILSGKLFPVRSGTEREGEIEDKFGNPRSKPIYQNYSSSHSPTLDLGGGWPS